MMEFKLEAKVTLDATPELIGALDRVAEAFKGGDKAAKPRARAPKQAEPEPTPGAGGKTAQEARAEIPAAQPAPPPAAPFVPLAATPAAPAPAAPAAATSPAAKGIGADEARRILIAMVQKHSCGDVLQAKLRELGYQTQYDMPDDVRADFMAWARQNFPVSDGEVL